jgi:hypothetical protein
MDATQMVKEFTDQLKEQKATIVELEKQLGTRKEQVLRLEGAIEALNMTLKKEDAEEVK